MELTGSPQLKSGRWYAVIRIPQSSGKDKQVWRTLHLKEDAKKSEVKRAFDRYMYELQEGIVTLDKDDFVAYADRWLEHKKLSVRKDTYQSYRGGFNKYIAPFYSARKAVLQKMKPQDVQDFADYLIGEAGLAPQTAKKYVGIVRGTLEWAEKNELVKKNPAKFVELPPDEESDVGCAISPDEVHKLLEASKGHPVHIAIFLAAFLGLRRSEIVGLRWENIDLESRTLLVCETTTQIYGPPIHEAKTKSKASRRVLHLSDPVFDFLKDLQKQQELDKAKYGVQYIDSDYVCKSEKGEVYQPQTFSANFRKVMKKAGVTECRLHDLRHTAVSLSIANGVVMKDVQVFMGHAQMSTTAEIYAHVSRASQASTADALSAALAG